LKKQRRRYRQTNPNWKEDHPGFSCFEGALVRGLALDPIHRHFLIPDEGNPALFEVFKTKLTEIFSLGFSLLDQFLVNCQGRKNASDTTAPLAARSVTICACRSMSEAQNSRWIYPRRSIERQCSPQVDSPCHGEGTGCIF
jgi:hypothetical protein